MRTPDIQMGDDFLMGLGVYCVAKLKAVNETKDLVALIQPTMDALEAAGATRAAAELLVMTRMAVRDIADYEADELLRRLYHDVKGVEGGRSSGPRGKLFFPKGLNDITGCSIPDQPGKMQALAGVLMTDDDPRFSGQAESIQSKADELDNMVEAFADATTQAAVAYGEVLRARAGFVRGYEKVYAQLIDRLGKRRAETFFKKPGKKRKPNKPAA